MAHEPGPSNVSHLSHPWPIWQIFDVNIGGTHVTVVLTRAGSCKPVHAVCFRQTHGKLGETGLPVSVWIGKHERVTSCYQSDLPRRERPDSQTFRERRDRHNPLVFHRTRQ